MNDALSLKMEEIYRLAYQFRCAIEKANENDEFLWRDRFHLFPKGCCDDACDLLGHYLAGKGLKTYQFQGTYWDGYPDNTTSHAWLLFEDYIIIDITGDQFKYDSVFLNFDQEVYVGTEKDFYRLFEKDHIYENCKLENNSRLFELYQKIIKYIR